MTQELTQLLQRAGDDPSASEAVLPRVYEELRVLAQSQMRGEQSGHTLQATALVHEAWMKLVGPSGESLGWDSRAHFFGAAAQAMRRILVDRARRVQSEKHGGHMRRQPLDGVDSEMDPDNVDFVALDGALTQLQSRDPRAAQVVELRFFGGLSVEDCALAMDISERTVAREWNVARAWLYRELGSD
jgi:RNA polymerase sigma factor (TIGR02999 family)